MKQIVRRVIDRKGKVKVLELPEPHLGPNQLLVRNAYSLISSGTEVTTLSKTPVELARQTISDPWMRHVVKQTVFATGLTQTAGRVWKEMLAPREIGYSGAGSVLAVGEHVEGFQVGDSVAYAATGHAEVAAPTINHIARVPASVDLRHAAFVTVGAIAMHSLRRAEARLGETIAVFGLGLVGQLCAALANAAGCRVIGIDLNPQRLEVARANGVELAIDPSQTDLERAIMEATGKHGADATIICAASKSNDIINASMEITRRQGRVVIVGYVGLDIHPKNFLQREIDLRYSRAYGPGSYHNAYEKGRVDYPPEFVRWSEKENLQEFIRLLETGRLDIEPLIGATCPVDDTQDVFDQLQSGTFPGIAALIEYDDSAPAPSDEAPRPPRAKRSGRAGISIVGCGNHVLGKHLPNLRKLADAEIRGIVTATGMNASIVSERYGVEIMTTDIADVLADEGTEAVMVCSSQHEHAEHLKAAIRADKAIFVEKPMVTRLEDFVEISELIAQHPVLFTLGLNRRYSSLVEKLREGLEGPVEAVNYVISSPFIPPDHWTLDPVEGAGRLITEGEHFIDLCHLLVGQAPLAVHAHALGDAPEDVRTLSRFALTIHYESAVAHIVFAEMGAAGYPRERVSVYAGSQVAVLDDFNKLTLHGKKSQSFGSGLQADMGHDTELAEFVAALQGRPNRMLDWPAAAAATLCMFAAQESIRTGDLIDVRDFQRGLASGRVPKPESSDAS